MFHAFSTVPGYRKHEISKRPTAADHVSPIFHLKKDTVLVCETLWVLSLIQWTARLVYLLMKLINNMEPGVDLFLQPMWTVEISCLYDIDCLAFLSF